MDPVPSRGQGRPGPSTVVGMAEPEDAAVEPQAAGYGQYCPITRAVEVLGERWTMLIVRDLLCGPTRFNDLARQLGGASKKMVSQRLREMEDLGLVRRKVVTARPVAVTYEITDFGRSALVILRQLKDWAEEHEL